MTQKEVREKINKSPHKEWFDSAELRLAFKPSEQIIEKIGFSSIYQFVDQQVKGWDKKPETLPGQLQNSRDFFNNLKNQILSTVNNASSWNANQIQNQWNSIHNNTLRNFPQQNILLYDTPEVDFLIDQYKIDGNRFAGAFAFLISDSIQIQNHDREFVAGVIAGYEFKAQEDSYLVKRGKSERKSFAQIKAGFEKYLSKSEEHLTEYLDTSENRVKESVQTIDSYLQNSKSNFTAWFEGVTKKEEDFVNSSKARREELEELYKKKLKLEAPAKYWSDRATMLKKEGSWWMGGLIVCTVLAILSLTAVLYFISDGTLKDLFDKTGSAVRWSIVFITFVSFLAYAIRTFAKLTFSSFHLVRDAEEREQLVYVYLALAKEKNIDETERHLVMQSIFSRADSGLLKDDSSPTMPGILEKLVNRGQ